MTSPMRPAFSSCWRICSGRTPCCEAMKAMRPLSSCSVMLTPKCCARRAMMKKSFRRSFATFSLDPRISARRFSTAAGSMPRESSSMRCCSRVRLICSSEIFAGSANSIFSTSCSEICSRIAERCSPSRRCSSASLTCSRKISSLSTPYISASSLPARGAMRSASEIAYWIEIFLPRSSSRSWPSAPVVVTVIVSPTFLPISALSRSSMMMPRSWPLPSSSSAGTTHNALSVSK